MDMKGKTIIAKNYRGLIRFSLLLRIFLSFLLIFSFPFTLKFPVPSYLCLVFVTGDIPMNVAERFSLYIQEKEELELRPVFTIDGVTFVYVKVARHIPDFLL